MHPLPCIRIFPGWNLAVSCQSLGGVSKVHDNITLCTPKALGMFFCRNRLLRKVDLNNIPTANYSEIITLLDWRVFLFFPPST